MNSKWEKASAVIVGGAGFVGSNLTRALLKRNVCKIIIIDNLLSSELENIPVSKRVEFWEGSIADDAVLDKLDDRYDYVFHLATYHGNQSSIHNPIADHENNLLTTLKLFNHIRQYNKLKKVIYSGAGCAVAEKTYDEARATSEDAPISLEMDSPYSISKIVGEFYAVYYHNRYKLPTVRARFQNVYGPGEVLGAGKWRGTPATVWRNVTPTFIYKALRQQALPLENEGLATRDFIYVDDIVEGLLLCAISGKIGAVYNLASGVETRISYLADIINQITANPTPPKIFPKRDWDRSGSRYGSTKKAKEELNFRASVNLKDGLHKTVEWARENLDFIERTMRKHDRFITEN